MAISVSDAKGTSPTSHTPQVETAEIADSELDNISGGLVSGLVGSVTAGVDSVAPVSETLGAVTGTVEQTTGLNTAPVTGLVAGL
ncbi:type A2 lantipeptide [Streptomyces diastaticus]|uniref:type A2 lantipeptide n=1 Tax=Streptomyces diastaticus TaxID=1956 RepID=UPI003650AA66